jgi:hypothetical protein
MANRVENWTRFSEHMEEYIRERTVKKYSVTGPHRCDLISMTNDWKVCVWNILKYALRFWNGHGKDHDFEKMAHYCEMAWTLSGENLVHDRVESEKNKPGQA